ncbi:MAG: SAV_6107 family HEPN domain-containing protein [Actinomycetota bacterium]|nr:SAV_6107 family HEPN domain-containing protein [Actinomycetota bacterium]
MRRSQTITTPSTDRSTARVRVPRASRSEQPPLPSAGRLHEATCCLDRAEQALCEARAEPHDDRRYVTAHVAALRATAAVLVVRTRPQSMRRQSNAWVLLERVAPELAEWAVFFAAGAPKRAAAEAGHVHVVSSRDADDLVRDVETFLGIVGRLVGLGGSVAGRPR